VLDTFETDQSARYNFDLEPDKTYKVLGNAPEYFANEIEVTTPPSDAGDTDLERNIDIHLKVIDQGVQIVLENVYYDFDEYYLREDAVLELSNLLTILRQNPNITIVLGSHTDTNGTPQYNKILSENRAKAVIRYLVDNNIDPARLYWIGRGEENPLVYPEMSDEDEQINRRTEFRVKSIEYGE
jgi:outer membrane protein OmpA-like peptidoglycan-associated protein